jgi:hypothetical protein
MKIAGRKPGDFQIHRQVRCRVGPVNGLTMGLKEAVEIFVVHVDRNHNFARLNSDIKWARALG